VGGGTGVRLSFVRHILARVAKTLYSFGDTDHIAILYKWE